MYVRFYVSGDLTEIVEVPDDISEEELVKQVTDWLNNNVEGSWEIVKE